MNSSPQKASVLPLMNLEGCEGDGSDLEELSVSSKSRRPGPQSIHHQTILVANKDFSISGDHLI